MSGSMSPIVERESNAEEADDDADWVGVGCRMKVAVDEFEPAGDGGNGGGDCGPEEPDSERLDRWLGELA